MMSVTERRTVGLLVNNEMEKTHAEMFDVKSLSLFRLTSRTIFYRLSNNLPMSVGLEMAKY
jgi:hypothetical protein